MVRLQLESIAQEVMDLNLEKAGYTAFYVDGTDGLDTYPGDSWEQPFKTIQHAVDEAGSWAKIFVKAGTYAENVHVPSSVSGVIISGQSRDTTIIKPASSYAFFVEGTDCKVESLTAIGFAGGAAAGVIVNASRFRAENLLVGNQSNTVGKGIYASSEYGEYSDIKIDQSNIPAWGIHINAGDVEIYDCVLENVAKYAILIDSVEWADVHDNTIDSAGIYGGHITGISNYNSIYHNNFIASVIRDDTVGKVNRFIENFYSTHTTDINHDGLCDTPYTFTTGTDYQPIANRDGWEQRSLSVASDVTVPSANSTENVYTRDVVGNKTDTAQTTVGTTRSIIAYVKGILTEIAEILELARTGADIAVTAAETNLFIDDTPSKIINGMSIKIDVTDMGAADTYELRIYYRIESAGSYIQQDDTITYTGVQSAPLKVLGLEPYRYGCKVTAKKTAGTDRSFPIEAITEA